MTEVTKLDQKAATKKRNHDAMYDKCGAIARQSLRGGIISKMLEEQGLEMRPGKDAASVNKAVALAVKRGHGKLETELMMITQALMLQFRIKTAETKSNPESE